MEFLLAIEKAELTAIPLPKLPMALFPDLVVSSYSEVEDRLLMESIAAIYREANLSVDILVPTHHAHTSREYFHSDYYDYVDEVRLPTPLIPV